MRTLSEFERGQRLINPPLLGDDKPSVLMSKMTALLGTHQPCFLFRALFLQRLPEFIQSTLVHSKVEDYQELAKAADIAPIPDEPGASDLPPHQDFDNQPFHCPVDICVK